MSMYVYIPYLYFHFIFFDKTDKIIYSFYDFPPKSRKYEARSLNLYLYFILGRHFDKNKENLTLYYSNKKKILVLELSNIK